ncbi:MAG: AraC family transcriptional regulator [Lachnospiraceae bacterium]|nr:AraC family transcriptional regulator [Lachnospiraceae bacterium]
MTISKEWIYKEYINREDMIIHAPYEPEMEFYSYVKTGDLNKVNVYLKRDFTSIKGLGKLSDNQIRNFRYHFIITAAMISRACIDAGLSLEQAYSLSDFYIQKVDKINTLHEIDMLHKSMVVDYTKLMKKTKASTIYSKPVVHCINYIYSHLHMRITLDALASEVSLSPGYLSRLFKKEMGMSVSEYISVQKIETAKNMLRYSDYSPSFIASILGYPSQSYFTQCFKKATGVTPKRFI